MMRKANSETDQISRSLLQKAVRRGNLEVTKLAIKGLLRNKDFDWVRKRLAVITFEECWSYGANISYEKDEELVTNHYLTIARAVKNKDAAGLGSLAYALSQGDGSVLDGDLGDVAIKIIAEAVRRPNDFWDWIRRQRLDDVERDFVERADKGFRKAGWPWDRAFAQSAAYLAVTTSIPKTEFCDKPSNDDFPFWVCIDKHTKEGKLALREAARLAGLKASRVLWLGFYFESTQCNELVASLWWDRELRWRMKKLQMSPTEARITWERIRPTVIDILKEETERLRERILTAAEPLSRSTAKQQLMF